MRVFLNGEALDVEVGATVAHVLKQFDEALLEAARGGGAVVSDGVGRAIALDDVLAAGAVLRAVPRARRQAEPDPPGPAS